MEDKLFELKDDISVQRDEKEWKETEPGKLKKSWVCERLFYSECWEQCCTFRVSPLE